MAKNRFRNLPCPCGSGKKTKKCHGVGIWDKKPRSHEITMDMGRPIKIDSFRVERNGHIQFFSDGEPIQPMKADVRVTYKRESKHDKTTFSASVDPRKPSININHILMNYDLVYAIDTHTRKSDNEYKSVSCAIECQVQKSHALLLPTGRFTISFKPKTVDEVEKRGIVTLIRAIMDRWKLPRLPQMKVGIITDHDLNNIVNYNSRTIPLIPQTKAYLPPGFELLYASSDLKNDTVCNHLLSRCHKELNKEIFNK